MAYQDTSMEYYPLKQIIQGDIQVCKDNGCGVCWLWCILAYGLCVCVQICLSLSAVLKAKWLIFNKAKLLHAHGEFNKLKSLAKF